MLGYYFLWQIMKEKDGNIQPGFFVGILACFLILKVARLFLLALFFEYTFFSFFFFLKKNAFKVGVF